jgi:hypothetical protein
MTAPDGVAELARIDHELSILRERYANFERNARWVDRFVSGGSIAVAGFGGIVLAAGRSWGLPFLLVGLLIWAGGYYVGKDGRTMDVVSHTFRGSLRSEAEAVVQMIAEREQRLAELKGETR